MTETQKAVNRLMGVLAESAGELLVRSAILRTRVERMKRRIIRKERNSERTKRIPYTIP